MGDAAAGNRVPMGVSPAYFVSRYGDRFSPRQVADALTDIAGLGYGGFQLEVYHREYLQNWVSEGARIVRQRSADSGLQATQFVAHFMMEAFSTPGQLNSDAACDLMRQVLDIVAHFDGCRLITLPVGPFDAGAGLSVDGHRHLMDRLVNKIGRLIDIVAASPCRLALEVIPGSLISGSDGFLRLCDHLGSPSLGMTLDTGHAWAAKENIYLLPAKLGPRILGTHICDNLGHENVSLRPGAGSIHWSRLIAALTAAGYRGSYDLEIICPSQKVQSEYRQGISVIEELLNASAVAA